LIGRDQLLLAIYMMAYPNAEIKECVAYILNNDGLHSTSTISRRMQELPLLALCRLVYFPEWRGGGTGTIWRLPSFLSFAFVVVVVVGNEGPWRHDPWWGNSL
jgi:hypothetical protein